MIEVASTAWVGCEELRGQQGRDASPGLRIMGVLSMKLVDGSVVQSQAEFNRMAKGEVGFGMIIPKIHVSGSYGE